MSRSQFRRVFPGAFRYSIPVLLGYLAIGVAFGLLLVNAGYPAWLAFLMSLAIYAGAGQYLAVGLFAAGAGLAEIALVTLVVNARHLAYGFSLMQRLDQPAVRRYRPYIVFALTDETFALLSSLPESGTAPDSDSVADRGLFMFLVALLDHGYWVAGSVLGALAGSLLPFKLEGLEFALTALFLVLMTEQVFRIKRFLPFLLSAAPALLATFFMPGRIALLSALGAALLAVALFDKERAL